MMTNHTTPYANQQEPTHFMHVHSLAMKLIFFFFLAVVSDTVIPVQYVDTKISNKINVNGLVSTILYATIYSVQFIRFRVLGCDECNRIHRRSTPYA